MDTVARRRRGSLGAGEQEAELIDREVEFQTALGQGGSSDDALGGFLHGDASPGTLESGGVVGPNVSVSGQLPVANPFHSDRVKSEVQLLRNRPATLDEDAARLRTEVDDTALGDAAVVGGNREPDYGLFLGPTGEGTAGHPRVARVESAGTAPVLSQSMGTEWKPEVAQEGATIRAQESDFRRVVQGDSGEDPEAGIEEEQRELIPVEEDRLSRVEALLARVLQENESLRRQVQAESNSSFQSARTPADQPASPMRHLAHFRMYSQETVECTVISRVVVQQGGSWARMLFRELHMLWYEQGYLVSPGGTSIKPPALPPPASPRDPLAAFAMTPSGLRGVKQIFVGLSPGAVEWYASVEGAAYESYHRWLMADPLGRLSVDPSSVVAGFDVFRFQRVESRAVTLLLAALPSSVKDDLVMNRWLSSAAILFRVLCIWQPGGSSERAHLLSQLVQPEVCRSFKEALPVLRRWQQNLQRAREIQASLPDASLLIKGVDQATSTILSAHPMIGFRVNAFRHRSGLDYNPSTAGVVQLVRLVQAEFEAAALIAEGSSEKRPRNAAASAALPRAENPTPPAVKAGPEAPPSVARVQSTEGEAKGGKSKGKGKGDSSSAPLCHKFTDGTGCRFGDSCLFKHDRSKARRDGRCLACGQSGHYRPECSLVAPENRVVLDSGSEASPSSGNSPPAKGSGKAKAKAKYLGHRLRALQRMRRLRPLQAKGQHLPGEL
ncbi:unnamed protein product [Symbiodinium sp. CCMP2456]|nr:unnamed protein product [Symbiodinium sp. CCMP2456]